MRIVPPVKAEVEETILSVSEALEPSLDYPGAIFDPGRDCCLGGEEKRLPSSSTSVPL